MARSRTPVLPHLRWLMSPQLFFILVVLPIIRVLVLMELIVELLTVRIRGIRAKIPGVM